MSQVRVGQLDSYCEAIAEDREALASARADEQSSLQGALRVMKAKKIAVYKHARVELAFVPGADKIRARVTKDNEDSSADLPSDAGRDDREEERDDREPFEPEGQSLEDEE